MRVARSLHAACEGLRYRVDHLHAGQSTVRPLEAAAVEVDARQAHGLQLHLGLPLVDVGVALAADVAKEAVSAEIEQPSLSIHVLARAHAFGAFRYHDQVAAW